MSLGDIKCRISADATTKLLKYKDKDFLPFRVQDYIQKAIECVFEISPKEAENMVTFWTIEGLINVFEAETNKILEIILEEEQEGQC